MMTAYRASIASHGKNYLINYLICVDCRVADSHEYIISKPKLSVCLYEVASNKSVTWVSLTVHDACYLK